MNPLLFRAIAALLDYPSHELSTDLPELRALLMSDKTLTKIGQQQLNSFFDYMLSQGDYDLQENYVACLIVVVARRCICLNMCMVIRVIAAKRWLI